MPATVQARAARRAVLLRQVPHRGAPPADTPATLDRVAGCRQTDAYHDAPNTKHLKHVDGSPVLSQFELGEKLKELAREADDGEPKTGRRYYYLCLSNGYIRPDMGPEGKGSRDAFTDRVGDVLKKLRLNGELPWGMVLDLTRELDEPVTYRDPREARQWLRDIYDEDRWLGA